MPYAVKKVKGRPCYTVVDTETKEENAKYVFYHMIYMANNKRNPWMHRQFETFLNKWEKQDVNKDHYEQLIEFLSSSK